jgi:hypothetical protein
MACAQGIKMMGYQWIWKEKVRQLILSLQNSLIIEPKLN